MGVPLLSSFSKAVGVFLIKEAPVMTRPEWECQNLSLVQLLVIHASGGQHFLSDSQMYKDSLDIPHSSNESSVLPPILIERNADAYIKTTGGLRTPLTWRNNTTELSKN